MTIIIYLDSLIKGNKYDRNYLAKLWGYKDFHAISRGIVTPKNEAKIILFITKTKQSNLTQYFDHFDRNNNLLFIDGEDQHQNDERLINSLISNDSIFLFYREIHHKPFEYLGEIYLSYYIKNNEIPSKFVFSTNKLLAKAYSEICCEENSSGCLNQSHGKNTIDLFNGDSEGRTKIIEHITYERSLKNRAKAIEIHGTTCSVCGFNFNNFYGKDLASDYIEIHHVKPVSTFEGTINPETDLIPVCSNCHRMIHRYRNSTLSIDDLRYIILNHKII